MERSEHQDLARTANDLLNSGQVETPFLMVDARRIDQALERFRTQLPRVKLFYATKSNAAFDVLEYLAEQGLHFDVASAGEIDAVRAQNVSGDRMFVSTPVKSDETIRNVYEHSIESCAVDTVGEIERLALWQQKLGSQFRPKVFVRFKVESKAVALNLNTKFGCTCSEAIDIIQRAHELGFTVTGLCFHVGTQCLNADNYFLGVGNSILIAEEVLRRFGIRLTVINIGGGFGDERNARAAGLSLDGFYAAVGKACQKAFDHGFEVYAEPGRCITSSAGTLVTSVLGTSLREGRNWAYLNDGIYGAFSIKLYERPAFEFIPLQRIHRAPSASLAECNQSWTIAGPTCDSLDVIAEDYVFSRPLYAGDILLTPEMGAYTIGTASTFNGFKVPPTILVHTPSEKGKQKVVGFPPVTRLVGQRTAQSRVSSR